MRRLKVLIWHIHGSYLNTLAQLQNVDWYLPVKPDGSQGYGGRGASFIWPDNVFEVPAGIVNDINLDVLIFQTPENLSKDYWTILSDCQRRLPKIYLEHNTPKPHPVDSRHVAGDAGLRGPAPVLVHVTQFNRAMWNNNGLHTVVIEHSTAVASDVSYTGNLPRGISLINEAGRRGRVVGLDLLQKAQTYVDIELAGMKSELLGGLGDIPYRRLHRTLAEFRFLFSPMRYTSLPLAVIEAMTIGMPVVALATTELPSVIEDGKNGFVSCDLDRLIADMKNLSNDKALAQRIGDNAKRTARERFGLHRFTDQWHQLLRAVAQREPVGVDSPKMRSHAHAM